MSSSPISSSSSSGSEPAAASPFDSLADIVCEVSVLLGTGTVSVRRCLGLQRASVLRLGQSAGEDLQVLANGSLIARGEVVIVEDSTALRITGIPNAGGLDR